MTGNQNMSTTTETVVRTFDTVAVLGFGAMGAGIAQACSAAGCQVVVLDTAEGPIQRGMQRVIESTAGSVQRGKLSADERTDLLARITATVDTADLASAELVIEAVAEDLEVKRVLLGKVADVVSADTVIATNTSALSVTALAAAVPHPQRFAGFHFFNPVAVMRLIEVVRALQTDPRVVAQLCAFGERIGKVAVETRDSPGFIVNRLLMPYLNDVVQAYDDGLASALDIDTALELGLGYRMGPLSLLDLIGLDVHEHATRNAYEATLDRGFAPPPLLARMVAAGFLGEKSGHGLRVGQENT
jgi:3-hydroxybutyryl-CoA dehydrogenase